MFHLQYIWLTNINHIRFSHLLILKQRNPDEWKSYAIQIHKYYIYTYIRPLNMIYKPLLKYDLPEEMFCISLCSLNTDKQV